MSIERYILLDKLTRELMTSGNVSDNVIEIEERSSGGFTKLIQCEKFRGVWYKEPINSFEYHEEWYIVYEDDVKSLADFNKYKGDDRFVENLDDLMDDELWDYLSDEGQQELKEYDRKATVWENMKSQVQKFTLWDFRHELEDKINDKLCDAEVIDKESYGEERDWIGFRELLKMKIPNDESVLFYYSYGDCEEYLGLVTTDFWGKTLKEYDEEEPSTFELPELRTAELWSYLTPEEQDDFKKENELNPFDVLHIENIGVMSIKKSDGKLVVGIARNESMFDESDEFYTIKSVDDVNTTYWGENKERLYNDIMAGAKYILAHEHVEEKEGMLWTWN